MTQVEVTQDGFVVDAAVTAEAFSLKPQNVQALMRNGEIASISETGVGEDAGRARLTFRYHDRAVQLVVDQPGTILKRASFPVAARQPIGAKSQALP